MHTANAEETCADGDMRVHDHGGLAAAASAREIHCVAILDPEVEIIIINV